MQAIAIETVAIEAGNEINKLILILNDSPSQQISPIHDSSDEFILIALSSRLSCGSKIDE